MARSRTLPVYYRVLFEAGSFSGLSDSELLARFVNRDSEAAELAFEALVERHGQPVLRICRAVIRNEHDAEDAFQAIFLVLASKAAKLRVRDSLGPWLAAVARRIARGARAAAIARAARDQRAAGAAAEWSDRGGDDADVASVLHEEIDLLPERYRLPLVLCDLESQSHQEAARRLGWPLGTVKSRQARARARLRARLSRRGLSGVLPPVCAFRSARAVIPDKLMRATARAAVDSMSSRTGAQAVSASVSTLVTNSLRAMIMIRVSKLMGVLLTVGVAATVLAQTGPKPTAPPGERTSARLVDSAVPQATPSPVIEYEIKIWKDGVPMTERLKLRSVPGETVHLDVSEGAVDLRFRPRIDPFAQAHIAEFRVDRNAVEQSARQQQMGDIERAEKDTLKKRDEYLAAVTLDKPGPAVVTADKPGLAVVTMDKTGPGNSDHERRLLEIERKLERILSVLDRQPRTNPESPNRLLRP